MRGAVLVGGESRRMGRDKALIQIDGVPLVERAAAVLTQAGCREVFAVGKRQLTASVRHVDDLHPGEGPLGGIITALGVAADMRTASLGPCGARTRSDTWVLVIACDLVALRAGDVEQLVHAAHEIDTTWPPESQSAGRPHVVMARSVTETGSARLEPLCAIWNVLCQSVLQRHFDNGQRAVKRSLEGIVTTEVELSAGALRNVNAPQDLFS